jgi:hypothetical protein
MTSFPHRSAYLDMLSEAFDAEEALLRRPESVLLPYPAIRAVDNVARWLSITQAQARQREAEARQLQQDKAKEAELSLERESKARVDYTMHPNHPMNREKNQLATSEEAAAKMAEEQRRRADKRASKHVLLRMQRTLSGLSTTTTTHSHLRPF